MSRRTRTAIAVIGLLFLAGLAGLGADDPKEKGTAAGELVGTWRLVSARYGGEESPLPQDLTTLKHVTPTHYMWASFDKDGQVTRTAGGPYTYQGGVLKSTPEYGFGPSFEAIKQRLQSYRVRVEGTKWYQNGTLSTGQSLEEVWERVEKK